MSMYVIVTMSLFICVNYHPFVDRTSCAAWRRDGSDKENFLCIIIFADTVVLKKLIAACSLIVYNSTMVSVAILVVSKTN